MMSVIGCNIVEDSRPVTIKVNDRLSIEEVCVYYYDGGYSQGGPVFTPKYTEDGIESCK